MKLISRELIHSIQYNLEAQARHLVVYAHTLPADSHERREVEGMIAGTKQNIGKIEEWETD